MTLKEKFEKEILTGDELYFITAECEQIADDFAIGFVEWYNRNNNSYPRTFTIKQLLGIYKKTL